MYFLFIRYDMFHFNKHFNRIIVITGACLIITAAPIFANAQPVVDSPANVKLQNIYDRLGSMYQNCMVPQYTILSTYCNYKLSDLNQSILAVGGQVADVSSKLLNTNNYLNSIDSKTKDYTQYIDTLEASASNLVNSLNNIDWDYNYSGNFYDSSFNTISSDVTVNNNSVYYFGFNTSTWGQYSYQSLYKLVLPIYPNSRNRSNDYEIKFYNNNSSNTLIELKVDYTSIYNSSDRTLEVYLLNPYLDNDNLYINVIPKTTNDSYYVYLSFGIRGFSMKSDNSDYYKITEFIFNKINNNNLSKLTEIYASDDVIAAKENQQAYEDQALNDFTGSGSAAASGSDTTNMKNVSGAIKSGLDSGGSVNGVLGVFNTSGGLWDWFSQSNYDEINGPQTRSRGSDEYIDFYNINHEELERLLMEDYR